MEPHPILRAKLRSSLIHTFLIVALILGLGGAALADTAALTTCAPDYSAGATAVIDVDPVGGPRGNQVDILPTSISDLIMRSYGEYFYRIERYKSDSVAKFHISDPKTPLWQYSTLDSPDQVSNNPHDMIFASQTKAYMPMYGSTVIWIVNPSATDEAGFKTGILDITHYADSDGITEMHEGIIVGGKLFVMVQRMDRDNSWLPTNNAYIAVFDVATDTEIDTGMGVAEGLMGIPLEGNRPINFVYVPVMNKLIFSCAGKLPTGAATGYEYTGGIYSLDPDTYEVTKLIDDGDADNHPYGGIGCMEVVNPTKGYFVGYAGYSNASVYPFNPTTGEVGSALSQLSNKNITIANSGGLMTDKNNLVWVTNQTDAQVFILNPDDDSVDEIIDTSLNPLTVAFCADPGGLSTWTANWYSKLLDREANQDELTATVAALQSGTQTAQGLVQYLVNSDEFVSRDVTDAQYIEILFQAFFNRSATTTEQSYYQDYLSQSGTRDGLVAAFISTSAFWRSCKVLGVQAF